MKKTITLMELVIAIALLGVVILGATSFDASSRQFLHASERKTQVLNEAVLILDSISKDALTATGTLNNAALSLAGTTVTLQCPTVVTYTFNGNTIQRTQGADVRPLSTRVMNFTVTRPNSTPGTNPATNPASNTFEITLNLRFDPARATDAFSNPEVTVRSSMESSGWSLR